MRYLAACLVIASLLWMTPATRTAPADRAALLADLPPGTLIAVYVPDVPWLLQQWEASPFYHFFEDPGAAGFFAPLQKQVTDLRREMTDQKGVDPADLERFFNGGLVLAGIAAPVSSASPSASPIEWVIVFNHNGSPAIVERLKKMESGPGVSIQRESATRAGHVYTHIRIVREETAAIPAPKSTKKNDGKNGKGGPDLSLQGLPGVQRGGVKRQVIETYDDYFDDTIAIHAATAGQPIEAILDRLGKTGQPSFADWAKATPLRAEGRGPGDVEVYADVRGLIQTWGAPGKDQTLLTLLKGLRLEEIQSAAVAARLSPDRLTVELALRAPQPRQGIARLLFAAQKAPVRAAALVPPQALLYDATSYPLAAVWAIARQTLREAFPALDAALGAQFQAIAQQGGVNLERDILGHLGPNLVHFSLPLTEGGPPRSELTVMLASDDATSLSRSLDRLLGFASQAYGAFYAERTLTKGHTLWQVFLGQRGTQLGAAPAPVINLCLGHGWLMISPGMVGIESVTRRLEESARAHDPALADLPAFQQVMARLPADRVQEAFTNLNAIGGLLAPSLGGGAAPAGGAASAMLGAVNLHASPTPEIWQKYFGPLGAARQVSGDQMRVTMELYYPPK